MRKLRSYELLKDCLWDILRVLKNWKFTSQLYTPDSIHYRYHYMCRVIGFPGSIHSPANAPHSSSRYSLQHFPATLSLTQTLVGSHPAVFESSCSERHLIQQFNLLEICFYLYITLTSVLSKEHLCTKQWWKSSVSSNYHLQEMEWEMIFQLFWIQPIRSNIPFFCIFFP